jgi:hypothetical protein
MSMPHASRLSGAWDQTEINRILREKMAAETVT